jgi:serine/threonine protein kinase
MAKTPEGRYASAGELANAFAGFLAVAAAVVPSGNATPDLRVDLSNLQIGQEPIPGYRLSKHLMSYDLGHIYKADGPGGFPVALQFKPRSQGEHQRLLDKSVDLMQIIHHPHLLSIFGVWRMEKAEIVATEFADSTLEDRLQQVRRTGQLGIAQEELLQYMEDAAKGIDFLNEPRHTLFGKADVSVVHGDIRPSHLRLVGGRVKVAEFVFAECLNLAHTDWDGRNDTRGTPAYMAPERVRGETSIQTDQYSLAATYYYLRTGLFVFAGVGPGDMLYQRQEKDPELVGLPQDERRVLMRALARKPKERWSSCHAFVKALQESSKQ